jgi:hypothetical protein
VSKTSGTSGVDFTTHKIRKLTEKLRNDEFYVFDNCENLIHELENYRYHEVNYMGFQKEVPMKVNDHLLDATLYLLVSLPEWVKSTAITEDVYDRWVEELPQENLFTKGGFY